MGKKTKDITGLIFGEITALAFHHKEKGKHVWLCRCSCGNEITKRKEVLLRAGHPDCGKCKHANTYQPKNTGLSTANKKTYAIWSQIKQRCYNRRNAMYPSFNRMGIEVCPEWKNDFSRFLKDMGKRPNNKGLYRLDMCLGFSKENCIWSDRVEIAEIRHMLG